MKKLLPLSLLLFIASLLHGQRVETLVFVQSSAYGNQNGITLRYNTAKRFIFGAFAQTDLVFGNTEAYQPQKIAGLETGWTVTKCGKVSLAAIVKSGVVNGQFLTIQPELETCWQFSKAVAFLVSAGVRSRQSTTSIKLSITPSYLF